MSPARTASAAVTVCLALLPALSCAHGFVPSPVAAVAPGAQPAASVPETAAAESVAPLVVLTGASSEVTERSYERIRTPEDWQAAWARHSGRAPSPWLPTLPAVDFTRCEIVAAFSGDRHNSAGLRFEEALERDGAHVLRFDEMSYQTMETSEKVRTFGFFVVARSERDIVLEENVQSLIRGDPIWRERARLVAP